MRMKASEASEDIFASHSTGHWSIVKILNQLTMLFADDAVTPVKATDAGTTMKFCRGRHSTKA